MKAMHKILAVLPIFALASVHAVAADLRLGGPEAIVPVSVTTGARDKPLHARAKLRESYSEDYSEELAPLAYGAFAPAGEGADEDIATMGRSVRLYPIESSGAPARAAEHAAPASAAKDSEASAQRPGKAPPPEPGRWAMILAGLLGVGAIARRRISA